MSLLSSNRKYVFFLLILIVSCTQPDTEDKKGFEKAFTCDAELLNDEKNRFVEDTANTLAYGNVNARTEDVSFSGKYSIKLTPSIPYGFTTELKGVGPDQYIQVTVWRKNSNNQGVIVIDGGEGFYNAGKYVVENRTNGWQKIYLEVYTPPTFLNRNVKIFVWDNSPDTVYFDDLRILYRDKKEYPDYGNIEGLQFYTDDASFRLFNQKRVDAFNTTVLVNSDEDYVDMMLYDGSDFLDAKCRLKGDLVDHIQGDKLSFRVKLKKDFAWKNLRTFSIQNPATRNFLYEWMSHNIFNQEDLLTTRYGFVPVKMNNRSLGIYAWEEHFEKQLIESNDRREGPILRFDESIFWQRVLEIVVTGRQWDIDYFDAAEVIPFGTGLIASDSLMRYEFEEGLKLMAQYKKRSRPVSEVFNIDKLASYYALIDLTQAYHGFAWHNQRFYYNPVTCLLEPIAFDGYIEGGIYKRFEEPVSGLLDPAKVNSFRQEELLLFQVFSDSLFNRKYINCLKKYSTPEFINSVVDEYKNTADSLATEIRKEFPYYTFNFDYLKNQAAFIRQNIDKIRQNVGKIRAAVSAVSDEKFRKEYTHDINRNLIPFMIHAYYNPEKQQLDILNFHNDVVKILGAFMAAGLPESFDPSLELQSFNGLKADHVSVELKGQPLKILFSIENEMFETEVNPWSYPDSQTTRQLTEKEKSPNLTIEGGKVIFDGEYTCNTDIVIPENITAVIFKAGTKMNLLKGAGFFSWSPVFIEGTEAEPVVVFSGDNTAQGFNVIDAPEKSVLRFAEFRGLSSLHREGWQTPAAVSFYQSDIQAGNCIFASNHNCDDALNVVRSDFHVEDCRFENTFADAFDSDFCTGDVIDCNFYTPGNDAIDFSGSTINISGCNMFDVVDKAISGGEKSHLKIKDCVIERANIGIASKDLSKLVLDNICISDAVYGMVAFKKKVEYGPASIIIDNLKLKNNIAVHKIEEGSVLKLNGTVINGVEKNLAEKLYQ